MTKAERQEVAEERNFERLRQFARDNSDDDPVLAEILFYNLRYNWGKGRNPRTPRIDHPHVVNGVKFWPVGHNASHEFYVGTDGNGKRFRYSVGESCTVDMYGKPLEWDDNTGWFKEQPGMDTHLEEVANFHGYYGHF